MLVHLIIYFFTWKYTLYLLSRATEILTSFLLFINQKRE